MKVLYSGGDGAGRDDEEGGLFGFRCCRFDGCSLYRQAGVALQAGMGKARSLY